MKKKMKKKITSKTELSRCMYHAGKNKHLRGVCLGAYSRGMSGLGRPLRRKGRR